MKVIYIVNGFKLNSWKKVELTLNLIAVCYCIYQISTSTHLYVNFQILFPKNIGPNPKIIFYKTFINSGNIIPKTGLSKYYNGFYSKTEIEEAVAFWRLAIAYVHLQ